MALFLCCQPKQFLQTLRKKNQFGGKIIFESRIRTQDLRNTYFPMPLTSRPLKHSLIQFQNKTIKHATKTVFLPLYRTACSALTTPMLTTASPAWPTLSGGLPTLLSLSSQLTCTTRLVLLPTRSTDHQKLLLSGEKHLPFLLVLVFRSGL